MTEYDRHVRSFRHVFGPKPKLMFGSCLKFIFRRNPYLLASRYITLKDLDPHSFATRCSPCRRRGKYGRGSRTPVGNCPDWPRRHHPRCPANTLPRRPRALRLEIARIGDASAQGQSESRPTYVADATAASRLHHHHKAAHLGRTGPTNRTARRRTSAERD